MISEASKLQRVVPLRNTCHDLATTLVMVILLGSLIIFPNEHKKGQGINIQTVPYILEGILHPSHGI